MFSDSYNFVIKLLASCQQQYKRDIYCGSIGELFSHEPSISSLFWNDGFGSGGQLDAFILEESKRRKQACYRDKVFALAPLYVSSICKENCLYCNFRTGNKDVNLERVRLSKSELEHEALFLIKEKNLRVIELVYSSDPSLDVASMCSHVELVRNLLEKHGGGVVGINVESLDEREYRSLLQAGLNFIVLWQETYNKSQYRELHPGKSKKTDFEYRVNAYERMINAGIKNIGMGVLSGLADWKFDWAMLIHHEAYLFEKYGVTAAILGVPRLKETAGALVKNSHLSPTDQEFLTAIALHNIFSPNTMAFVNTRENWNLCLKQSAGGGCLFTFNCSTIPGGYSLGRQGHQFPTTTFDAPVFSEKMKDAGLSPVFSWTFEDMQEITANMKKKVDVYCYGSDKC